MNDIMKCKKCGHIGKVVKISGLYYVQCHHCNKWDPYQFLGATPKGAISEWNRYNSSGKITEDLYV